MPASPIEKPATDNKLNPDFWKFWAGETISTLGGSFTGFALPLLVYKLTGSAVDLAIATAAFFLPYLFFGLVIGAWVDRMDRKRLMITVDMLRALAIGTVPLLAAFGWLSVWWIYSVLFITSTLGIFFQSAQFAAVPSLVGKDDLITANGRLLASYETARIIGPLLAGLLVVVVPVEDLLVFDALSFLVSSLALSLIRTSFNEIKREGKSTNIRQDIGEGLRYVWNHPVLRNISLMMALVNFVSVTVGAQRVLYAKERFAASDSEIGILYAAGSAGVVLLSLLAGKARKRWPFSKVILGTLMISGLMTTLFALTPWYWVALPLWALISGFGMLLNINTNSLRQTIVPNHMLGRVMSIAGVVAWSSNPLGAYLGGLAIEWTHDVVLVYAVIGILGVMIPLAFAFTALGRAEQYLPKKEPKPPPEQPAKEETSPELEEAVASS
ncbi:MAG TPA: MFS transporter [Chloroflexia bacterium]|jgi:MFS family permease